MTYVEVEAEKPASSVGKSCARASASCARASRTRAAAIAMSGLLAIAAFTCAERAGSPNCRHHAMSICAVPVRSVRQTGDGVIVAACGEIGRAQVGTPVTNAHPVCRLLLE